MNYKELKEERIYKSKIISIEDAFSFISWRKNKAETIEKLKKSKYVIDQEFLNFFFLKNTFNSWPKMEKIQFLYDKILLKRRKRQVTVVQFR